MERGPTYGPRENPNRAVELAQEYTWEMFEEKATAAIERAERERKGLTRSTISRKNEIAHDANMWLLFAEHWEDDHKRRYAVMEGEFMVFILDGVSERDPLDFVQAAYEARNDEWASREGKDPPQDGEDVEPDERLEE